MKTKGQFGLLELMCWMGAGGALWGAAARELGIVGGGIILALVVVLAVLVRRNQGNDSRLVYAVVCGVILALVALVLPSLVTASGQGQATIVGVAVAALVALLTGLFLASMSIVVDGAGECIGVRPDRQPLAECLPWWKSAAVRRARMQKLWLFPVLLALGCCVAGLYGAAHNQISYTVSSEYFTEFKFQRFGIPEEWPQRVGASVVGWQASWWMGLVIGVPILSLALLLPNAKAYWRGSLIAFGVAAATALVAGLLALAAGSLLIDEADLWLGWYPVGVTDRRAFALARTMHNFSYIGGGVGIFAAAIYLGLTRWRLSKQESSLATKD